MMNRKEKPKNYILVGRGEDQIDIPVRVLPTKPSTPGMLFIEEMNGYHLKTVPSRTVFQYADV